MLWVSYVPLTARLNAVLWHSSFIHSSLFAFYLLKNFDITQQKAKEQSWTKRCRVCVLYSSSFSGQISVKS